MGETQPAQKYLACIRALTDQCAALIWERDELQKQVWRYEKNGVTCQTYGHKIDSSCSECNVHENYTAAPQRTWVGLTDEEMDIAFTKTFGAMNDWDSFVDGCNWAESMLKEKNT